MAFYFITGNVTHLFLSFSRLKRLVLGQIKDTVKRYGIKRRGEWTKLTSKSKIRASIGILLLILFLIFPFLADMKQYISIPNEMITFQSEQPMSIPNLGNNYTVTTDNSIVTRDSKIYPNEQGETTLVYKKANIPVKKVNVSVLNGKKVIPGGQSVGVQLHTLGVLVVGHHLVKNNDKSKSPGDEAEIHVGDVILEMNGNKIKHLEDVKPIVTNAGKNNENILVKLKRGQDIIETKLQPALNNKDNSYQIGLYIRDSATGIGTISFYDEDSGKYGALGHIISDSDTKKPIEIHNGKIVRSSVTSIEKGNQGIPGEKQAKFSMKDKQLGTITKNSPFGIFGILDPTVLEGNQQKPMAIGLSHEVKKGPAHILTVVEGEKVEKFDIEIVNTIPQKFPATKGMVIKVTDERLLEKTGGIVQGMSGSPIIQNNKIVGAVTHVFVNDPTSGYGVHIEWMLEEAGIDIYKEKEAQVG